MRRLAGRPRVRAGTARSATLTHVPSPLRYLSLPSTQSAARKLADGGAAEGTVVVAAEQTAGRGRAGRSFHSPSGGLYFSIVLRPSASLSQVPVLGLAAGLAVAEAVQDVAGVRPTLKWPNDLLLAGRKLAGILAESTAARDGSRCVILGVGINVNVGTDALGAELARTATSLLSECGRTYDLDELLAAVLAHLDMRTSQFRSSGPSSVIDDWRLWPNMLGQAVHVTSAAGGFDGIARDLDVDGALLVSSGDVMRRVVASDVRLAPV